MAAFPAARVLANTNRGKVVCVFGSSYSGGAFRPPPSEAMHLWSFIRRSSSVVFCGLSVLAFSRVAAQEAAGAGGARPVLHSASYQIAAAVTALPEEMRGGAAVLGYTALGKPLVTLREGKNDMICLAPDPAATAFHAACYHQAMEPFMARGRSLRASGVTGGQVDTVRFAEVKAGRLKMPTQPSMLYQIFGGTFDSVTAKVSGGTSLFVTYIPLATPQTTGISARPSATSPWIMFPGTPKAHIMYAGTKM